MIEQGSLLWLIRHQLRIEWRELSANWTPRLAIALGLGVLIVLVAIWMQLLGVFGPLFQPPVAPEVNIIAGVMALVLLPVAVMIGINQSIKAVFERNDLDLLLASPLPARTVFASRLLGVSAYIFGAMGVFLLPLAIAGPLMDVPQLLGVIPLLIATALTGAAVGMLLTLLLVRIMGARQARTASQLLAALAGGLLIIALQLPTYLGGPEVSNASVARVVAMFQPGGILASDSPLWLPGRTLLLDPLPMLLTLAAATALVVVAAASLQRWFVLGVSSSVSVSGRRRQTDHLRFSLSRNLWHTMLRKEWRLLIRDPYLLSQTLLQLVYLIPLAGVVFFNRDLSLTAALGPALAAALIVLAGALGATLCRIVMAGEDAIDLLIAAPVPALQIRQAKLVAALLPVWVLTVPLTIGLMLFEPLAGGVAIVGVAVVTMSAAYIRFSNPGRAKRQDLFKRQGQGDQVLLVIDSLVPFAWAGSAWLLLAGSWWALATVAAALILVAGAWQRGRALGAAYAEMAPG